MTWFTETLHGDFQLRLFVEKTLFQEKTEHQDLHVFENPQFGRVLALDGIVQTTEGDEFMYHEMLAHVPILAHGAVKRVLVIGGGDGGTLKQVLRHEGVEGTLVEIDQSVIDLCRKYLPRIGEDVFDSPRAHVVIADGAKFVAETDDRFDVIIVDSTDPVGPGAVLFSAEFYKSCKRCLNEGGILITQNGVAFVQKDEVTTSYRRLTPIFKDVSFYVTAVPTYNGGFMTLGWATDNPELRRQPVSVIAERVAKSGIETRYYNADIHVGSFALPNFVRELMK